MNDNQNKISWINGLKGFACLIVFFHHFFLSFYDGIYYGDEVVSKTVSGFDLKLGYEPYGVFLNGNFAVCLFIMISAFLYAGKTIKSEQEGKKTDLFVLGVNRYLRLMPSVAVVGIVYYVLVWLLTKTGLNYAGITTSLSVSELIKHILFYQWITYDAFILGPLWCMYILFLGTFIAVFMAMLSKKERWYMPVVYLIMALASTYINTYYVSVVMGVFLADIYYNDRKTQWKLSGLNKPFLRRVIGILLIIMGLYLGGFPSHAEPKNAIFNLIVTLHGNPFLAHTAGSALLMAGLMILPKTVILSSKIFEFFGNVSFGIYLIHSVVINLLSYYLTNQFASFFGSYFGGVMISFLVTTIIVLLLAYAYHRLVEARFSKLKILK